MAFVWTCALELPVYAFLLARRFESWWTTLALTLVLNAITHPVLWLLVPLWTSSAAGAAAAEAVVVVVEGLLVAGLLSLRTRHNRSRPPARAALASGLGAAVLANLVSALVGLLIWT